MNSIKEIYKIGHGPSSSHTMAPVNATNCFLKTYPNIDGLVCNLYGSLALTGKGHLTDSAIKDQCLSSGKEITINFHMTKELPKHENGMELIGKNGNEEVKWTIYSVGGGDYVVDGQKEVESNQIYPHKKYIDIYKYCNEHNISLYEYVIEFEPDVLNHLNQVWDVMQDAIKSGLNKDGCLPGELELKRKAKALSNTNEQGVERLAAYAHAVSEENAGGGIIVTAPTCGACGVVPATFKMMQEKNGYSDEQIIEALAVAGLIGNIVKTNASISGAEAGCQAEIGTATSMAAAGLAYLEGGNLKEIEASAEIALEHQLGLTCDPVAGFVQIPCIQRNAVGATKAILAAKLAKGMSEDNQVSFDIVVEVMYETGKDMASGYRETAQAGLAKFYKIDSNN